MLKLPVSVELVATALKELAQRRAFHVRLEPIAASHSEQPLLIVCLATLGAGAKDLVKRQSVEPVLRAIIALSLLQRPHLAVLCLQAIRIFIQ